MKVPTDFLRNLVLTAINTGAAAKITYDLMEHPPLAALSPQMRRYVSLALATTIASLLFLAYCWIVSTWPATPQEWANDLVGVSYLAIMASQIAHGAIKLPAKATPPPGKHTQT